MGNAPEEKKVTIAQIGEMLRQAREKKGLTVEQAQKQPHLGPYANLVSGDPRPDLR